MRWYAQDEVNQEDSEQNEVDGMKKEADWRVPAGKWPKSLETKIFKRTLYISLCIQMPWTTKILLHVNVDRGLDGRGTILSLYVYAYVRSYAVASKANGSAMRHCRSSSN